jgi:hypothetical protein
MTEDPKETKIEPTDDKSQTQATETTLPPKEEVKEIETKVEGKEAQDPKPTEGKSDGQPVAPLPDKVVKEQPKAESKSGEKTSNNEGSSGQEKGFLRSICDAIDEALGFNS